MNSYLPPTQWTFFKIRCSRCIFVGGYVWNQRWNYFSPIRACQPVSQRPSRLMRQRASILAKKSTFKAKLWHFFGHWTDGICFKWYCDIKYGLKRALSVGNIFSLKKRANLGPSLTKFRDSEERASMGIYFGILLIIFKEKVGFSVSIIFLLQIVPVLWPLKHKLIFL